MFHRRTEVYNEITDRVIEFDDLAIETPQCDTPDPTSSHDSGQRLARMMQRNDAPLNTSTFDALFPMLKATEWPASFTERVRLEAGQDPCRNLIPIRGAHATSSSAYNASFLYDEEAVQKRVDMLWKEAVVAGASQKLRLTKDDVNMGPFANGTRRSVPTRRTCVRKNSGRKEGEGFGGQYLYVRLLVQYAAMHNMWYCHEALHLFGPHTRATNVTLGNELMGFEVALGGCRSCKPASKAAIVGYFNRRLESPNKEWLRVDGQLRLRLLSKVAQLRRKGLDLSTCQFKAGRRNVAVHIRRGDVGDEHSRYMPLESFVHLMATLQNIYHRGHSSSIGEGRLLFHIYAQMDSKGELTKKMARFGEDVVLHTRDRDLESFACMVTAEALITSVSQFSAVAAELRTGPSFRWRISHHHGKKVLDYPERQFGFRNETDASILQCLAKRTVNIPLVSVETDGR